MRSPRRRCEPDSVDLVVTSPPYNVDIDYGAHDDAQSYASYLEFSRRWLGRCFEWLRDDGRLCLNIPLDKNKDGQQSVGADLTGIAKDVGFRYHSTIVWNEGNISRRTAWGSWMSASAPYVIAPVELIVVLYRAKWKRSSGSGRSDIARQEFMDWTNGLWTFHGESRKRTGHPAPFPLELPGGASGCSASSGTRCWTPFWEAARRSSRRRKRAGRNRHRAGAPLLRAGASPAEKTGG